MTTTYATQVSREAPEIEALKVGLMDEARRLYSQPINLPAIEVAGPSLGQIQAADLARQGIGSYEPFLQAGTQAITQGMGLTQQGAQQLGNLNVAPQFGAAQGAFQSALGATSRLGGLGDVAAGYSAADTRRATQQLEAAMRGAGGIRLLVQPRFKQASARWVRRAIRITWILLKKTLSLPRRKT